MKLANRNARIVREKLMAEKELKETDVKRKKLSLELEEVHSSKSDKAGTEIQKVWGKKAKEHSKFRIRNELKDE